MTTIRLTTLLWTFSFLVSSLTSVVAADVVRLFKREDKLPYDTLPSTNCSVPSVCSNIGEPLSCRCSGLLTVCIDNDRRFCWGSSSLTQSTNCPTIPESCSSQFNGTASCLCNQDTVLCVDGYNHYCYGNYIGLAASASVSLQPIPTQQPSSPSSPSSPQSASSNPPSTSLAVSHHLSAGYSLVGLATATMMYYFAH